MAQVALIGHAKPKTSKVKAHISKTLSDHAVANSWWLPSSLPAWLNEEFYVQKIQPQLSTIKVRVISEAMQVSRSYSALIKRGSHAPWLEIVVRGSVASATTIQGLNRSKLQPSSTDCSNPRVQRRSKIPRSPP